MSSLNSVTWFALLSTVLLGCSDDNDQPRPIREEPGVQRYASPLLPWPTRATFNDLTGGKGAKLYRNLYYRTQVTQVGVYEQPSQLAALVALPSSLVAIYPPADAEGLIIAHGGIDRSWERISLTDIPVVDIGAVDAHATRDGGVIIGVRQRSSPQTIHLFSWRPGGAVQPIPFTRPAPSPAHWTNERCEDLAIGVSAGGDLDVVFRQNRDQLGASQKILHARRAAGQSSFVFATVDDTATFIPAGPDVEPDLGCRLRLAYGHTEQPVVLALNRELPRSALSTLNGEIVQPPSVSVLGYNYSGGAWTRGGPEAPEASSGGGTEHFWYTAQFDVARHPAGFQVSAMNRDTHADPELQLSIRGDASTVPTGLRLGMDIDLGNDPEAFTRGDSPASGGSIVVDDCGGVQLWYSESGLRNKFLFIGFAGNVLYCGGQRLAPVARFADDEWGFMELPVVARGPRTYHAAMCLMDDDRLAICEGGHDFTGLTPGKSKVLDESESPELVSSTPASGAVNVPTSVGELRVKMSRPPNDKEELVIQLSDVTRGLPDFVGSSTTGRDGGDIVIPVENLLPATTYRVHVGYARDDQHFTYIDKRTPAFTFRTVAP